jgi:ferredoxin
VAHTIDQRCDGCSACFYQCPVEAISGLYGSLHAVDPMLCIDCGVCGAICPVEAVVDEWGVRVARVPRDRRPRPVVHPDRCNGCGMCVDFCPFGCHAIVGARYAGVSIHAHPLRCVSCAECARNCIKGAITMEPVDLREYDPEAEHERIALYLAEWEQKTG